CRVAVTAHVADACAVDDLGEMHVGRPGYVGLGPIGAGVTTVALVLPLAEARRGERFFDELNRFPGVAGRFDPRRIVRRVLATGPFARWSRRPAANGQLLGRFATGVTVLTSRSPNDEPIGMTANSLASVSLEPPLVLVSVEKRHDMHTAMEKGTHFVFNILSSEQEALSRAFAASEPDR